MVKAHVNGSTIGRTVIVKIESRPWKAEVRYMIP
jgi:hypothetical protein|tara:strand:- start:327 stop:428 length:102 start_codon:yes stop_codon:yes gene_type:complete